MSDSFQQILLELPAPLLEKLGNAPAKKILELVEKFVEAKNSEVRPPRENDFHSETFRETPKRIHP